MPEQKGFWRWLLDKVQGSLGFVLLFLTLVLIGSIAVAIIIAVVLLFFLPYPLNFVALALWCIFILFVVLYVNYRLERD